MFLGTLIPSKWIRRLIVQILVICPCDVLLKLCTLTMKQKRNGFYTKRDVMSFFVSFECVDF